MLETRIVRELLVDGAAGIAGQTHLALLALDATAEVQGSVRTHYLAPLLAPLHELIPDLDIEGAFVQGEKFSLLQRGNSRSGINARIDWSWSAPQQWLAGAGPTPEPAAITRLALETMDGVALSFTDAAALHR